MKKAVRIFAIILSIVLCTTLFAGCGGNGEKTLRIGIIQYASHPSLDDCYNGVIKGIEEAGLKIGTDVTVTRQNAQASTETADQIARNMVATNYDIIIAIATPAAISAYSAARSSDIPVVFCAVSDPVSCELVSSLEKPGANCTGTSDLLNIEAQLKLIRALQPEAKKIGIIYTTSEANSVSHLKTINQLSGKYGFEIIAQGISSASDIPQVAANLVTKVDCINNFTDNLVVDNLGILLEQAETAGIPVYGSEIDQVKNGCLASESLDYVALGVTTGKMAADILRGGDASVTPVAVVKDSYPVINGKVAERLNITVPDEYAAKAEMIAD